MSVKLLIVGVLVFAISVLLLTKLLGRGNLKSKRALEGITRESFEMASDESVFLDEEKVDRVGESFLGIPLIGGLYRKLKLSGYRLNFLLYLLIFLTSVGALGYGIGSALNHMYYVGLGMALAIVLIISNTILGMKINKREDYYLNSFPDAVDMIVRSVKSGQPLLSALKMIAQSATQPLAGDVQRVIDEVSYGRPLPEALRKMAETVGFLDMNFFVVILSVQQETGGNLSEVLSNLSKVIRKRKQLRLKVKALTAQSKMTTMIFSSIPILQMGAIYLIKPDYLKPFWTQDMGVYMLLAGLACITCAIFLGRRISNLEV